MICMGTIMITAEKIVQNALSLGYHKCGIIPVELMDGYEARLQERMDRFPETKGRYEDFRIFSHLRDKYPWVNAIVICSYWYGKYRIPEHLKGRIAKYYLTDARRDRNSDGYKASVAFERFLTDSGLHVETDRDFGLTALRWAGMKAGIGIIRKNNFFYTEKGSYQYLEAFLIDRSFEHIEEPKARPCPDNCGLCIKSCPSHSLEAPFTMCRNTCVSCLTTWDGWDYRKEPLRENIGKWVYGCDVCQDVCPFNRKAWEDAEEFPGLEELSSHLTNEELVKADYTWLHDVLQPKLWYIPEDKVWRYKTNALNAIFNNYEPEYLPLIRKACSDPSVEVRRFAQWILEQLEVEE